MKDVTVRKAYEAACECYAAYGVDVQAAVEAWKEIPISVHCWQGDDIAGLEPSAGGTSGGILSTGSYPGKARNGDELRTDFAKAQSLLPGALRFSLHASYREADGPVDRDTVSPEHFQRWMDWAKDQRLCLDFNPTFFGHPKAESGLTLSSPDADVRAFWVQHAKQCRSIASAMGKAQGSPCAYNLWIPDGLKDLTPNRLYYRRLLAESLDLVFDKPDEHIIDSVESKLFGIGAESYTVGSHEFYMGYAAKKNLAVTLDAGHFHPTELVSDKLSALLLFYPAILLHVTRGVRWDSDHVVINSDELLAIMAEIKRAEAFDRVHIGLDFFDGSINRLAAWVIGARAAQKAALAALLEPTDLLRAYEKEGRLADRLALLDETRTLPVGAVYDMICLQNNIPPGAAWLEEVRAYESGILRERK